MRVITCTGYFSTGSSAIGDLLSEYDDCYFPSDYELRFIYDPDGLADLEFHLVENHNRHNSGHALKRYKKLVDFYVGNKFAPKNEVYFHNHWKEYSYQYIDKLCEFDFEGAWLYDYLDRGIFFHYLNSVLRKLLHKDLLSHERTMCSYPTSEQFLRLTKDYIRKLFSVANNVNSPVFIADQALPPSDIERYVKYFDDIKVVVVDRDPRDVFFLEKYIRKDGVLPTDVNLFCRWFEYTRRHRKTEIIDNSYGLYVQFEDLVYQYGDTVKKIEIFCGLDGRKHTKIKKHFVPEKSINNTQIWRRINMSNEQIRELSVIERELAGYLYDFPEDIELDSNEIF